MFYHLPGGGEVGTSRHRRNRGKVSVVDSIQDDGLYDPHELFSRYTEAMELWRWREAKERSRAMPQSCIEGC